MKVLAWNVRAWLVLATCGVVGCMEMTPPAKKVVLPSEPTRSEAPRVQPTPEQSAAPAPKPLPDVKDYAYQVPHPAVMQSLRQQVPIRFVTRSSNPGEWEQLANFWNEGHTEKTRDPLTGQEIEQKVVKIKVPLGLTSLPPVPEENPLTVAKVALGKQLYFDTAISSNGTVSCATCHDPEKGFTDQEKVSTGIYSKKGDKNAPTVLNSVYHLRQFWDGRAVSLEDQCQGPPQNPVEMYDDADGPPDTHSWPHVVKRIRANPEYVAAFRRVFGSEPTRDTIAKAIASYERIVLAGNSLHDRAELLMRERVADEGKADFTVAAVDYEAALQKAKSDKDEVALKALGLDLNASEDRLKAVAASLKNGHTLFFGKARCNSCHAGENFTDNLFHNLGVGVAADGTFPPGEVGRFGAEPTGHKNPASMGAQKTPTLRSLLSTAPYMHDGSEPTLETVAELYDRGGNPNPFLDAKMRDLDLEAEYHTLGAAEFAKKHPDVKVHSYFDGGAIIIPLVLKLSDQEKADLVLFLKALESSPLDPIITDAKKLPAVATESASIKE